MSRRFLTFVSAAATVSAIAWLLVLLRLDPCRIPDATGCAVPSALSVTLYFISFFVFLMSGFTLAGYLLRRAFQDEYTYDQMTTALRQGFLLALLSLGSLTLLVFEVLTWWSGLLFLAVIVLIEMYFLARKS